MDWNGLKKVAFGPLGLNHEQFWHLTPGEFEDLVEGYNWRKEQEDNRLIQLAWMTANLQRAKKLPKLEKLLQKKKPKQKHNKEQLEQEWKALQADFGL